MAGTSRHRSGCPGHARFVSRRHPRRARSAGLRGLGAGSLCAVTDRQAYRPVRTALLLIDEIRRQHLKEFAWSGTIDRLTGSDKVRLAIEGGTLPALLEEWDREAAQFRETQKPFLLYR